MISKSILCIRHGESTFNAARVTAGADPLHFDAPMSEVGHQQVRQARSRLREFPVELVIASPLTRALETATGLFADHPSTPTILVAALLRERVENSCDIGRSPTQLSVDFPSLALAHLADAWWHVDGVPDARGICVEPIEMVNTRVAEFKTLLSSRPETFIAVVGHGTFLYHLTGCSLANGEIVELSLA